MRRQTLLTVLAMLPALASAQQTWVKATSTNFEVYTTAGEQKAREAVLYFEHVRSFFRMAVSQTRSGKGRVRVIAFQSASEYKPYRPGEGRVAYAGGGPDLDRIVMQGIEPKQYHVAVHEYLHLLLKPIRNVPVWFDEGLAQVYQTLRPFGGKVIVGDLVPGALDTLRSARWLDLQTLCAVDHNSPYYTGELTKAGVFYSESWLLTHMLFLGEKYGTGFREFKRLILAGTPEEEAFQIAFNKTMWHVESDLRRYAEDGAFRAPMFDVPLEKSAEHPEIAPVTPFESRLVLADVLPDIGKADEARHVYEELAKENPASPDVSEGLGYLALRAGDWQDARARFARAIDLGSRNPRVFYRYSVLTGQGGDTRERRIALLRKSVELEPEYRDARLHLGYLLMSASDYAGAVDQFGHLKGGDPENAFRFFRAFAYACYRTGDKEGARANATRAAEAAQGPEEKASAKQLVAMIDSSQGPKAPAPPDWEEPEREAERPTLAHRGPATPAPAKRRARATIEGTLDQIDCQGTAARIRMTSDGRTVRLLIDKPESIEVRGGTSGAFTVTCGPQQPPRTVRIEYEPQVDEDAGTIGLVRVVETK